MPKQFIKIGFIPLAIFVATLFLLTTVLIKPVTAANPIPPKNSEVLHIAQAADFTLEKQGSQNEVRLGQIVTYTVKIKNDSASSQNFNLTDALPEGLSLRTTYVTATLGTVQGEDNLITWSGSLSSGEEASLEYAAIPPSTSSANQEITNVAVLEIGETSLEAGFTITTQPTGYGIWGRFVNSLAWVLVETDELLEGVGVPYAFGFAIILFTITVRLATFPLNMQQIKSSKAMQELQPKMKELQKKHKDDREGLAQAQMALYREHGVNPLGGCLPLLIQMPIWFALYRALIQLSNEGLLNEGFLWLQSLAGPVAGDAGAGFPPEWLFPFINGAPPLGWGTTVGYLVLPVLLIVSQLYMQQMMTPPSTDPQAAQMQQMMKFMPFMFGYFALVVPSGLTLYWFTSNILAMAQQYFTKTTINKPADTDNKKTPAVSPPIENTPVPVVNSAPAESTPVMPSRESRKNKNAKSKRKKRKR